SESVTSLPNIAKNEVKTSETTLKNVSVPIIEDWLSDSEDEDEIETQSNQIKLSFAKSSDDKDVDEVLGRGEEGSGIDDQARTNSSTQDVNTAGPSINTANTNINVGSLNINIVGPKDQTSRPDIMFVVCARFQVTPKVSHLHAVKMIFKYLKGQPKLGLWYPRDSPFDLEAFSNSDYAGASLDRKSTTGGVMDPKSNA
nr:uncharacterized mitochondrial protein AtMg00810-like [Tanacetum cinerariifolium]